MNKSGKGTWCGKNLEEMSREELYAVIWSIDELRRSDWKQHDRDMQMMAPKARPLNWIERLVLKLPI